MSLASYLRRIALFLVQRTALIFFHYPKVAYAWTRRLAGKRSFVVEEIPGELAFDNDRFAVFLIWQPKDVAWYVRNALDALADARINTVLVVNHPLTGEMRGALSKQCRHILIRDNTGFDIGGYQDATRFIRDNFSVGRLLYINDSVYFFEEGLSDMFGRMADSHSAVCTAFENWEFHYHVQSFCFSISREIFDSKSFIRFWNEYLPVNSRLWAINHGEIGLTQSIVKTVNSFEVIYSPSSIRSMLRDITIPRLIALNKYIPCDLRVTSIDPQSIKSVAEDDFINRLSQRSQIHIGGFLYRGFLRSPLIKRDLVYRMQYTIYEVESLLETVGHEGHLHEILSDMRRKGAGNQLPLLEKLQFIVGIK